MKRIVVLLVGVIIGILASLFFLRSFGGSTSRAKIANPFKKEHVNHHEINARHGLNATLSASTDSVR